MAESMKEDSKSLEVILQRTHLLISGASDPAVIAVMTGYGYGAAKVKEGETKLDVADQAIAKQGLEYAEKTDAAIKSGMVKNDFLARFTNRVNLCRILFKKNNLVREALELDEARKRTNSGIVFQASTFYQNLLQNPVWYEELVQFSISEDLLTEDQNILKDMLDAFAKQEKESAEAHTATINRDKAIDDVIEWTTRYKGVAKEALKPYPKLMEILGL